MTTEEALRGLTIGDCPTRREAVKTIRKLFEYGNPIDRAWAEIVDLMDKDSYGDYQLGYQDGLIRAAEIVDKYRGKK